MSSDTVRYFIDLTYKWSKILFDEEKVYEANPDKSKPKFFITAAYMYPNSPIHIGHGRTYLVADIIARFKRLQGYNVLFPMGFHYTGTPIITMAESIAAGDQELISLFKEVYNVPEDEIKKMKDPLYLARYFHRVSKDTMKLFGLSIDWRREFTTIDEDYKSFIHWQFLELYEKGFIVRGTHPVGWCPKHQMPVGMHDTKGDVEPEIGEFTAILFRDDEGIAYPTATLRPETIFGVTNLWVNPEKYYVEVILSNGDKWIIGEEAAERLKYQLEFTVQRRVLGKELVGKIVTNPVTGEKVRVLPATFVDSSFATGVVMSVPAHAPYDAIALEELKHSDEFKYIVKDITPRVIIEVNGRRVASAYEALKQFSIVSQKDRDKLDEATRYVYSFELQYGRMAKDLPVSEKLKDEISARVCGKSVKDAREAMKEILVSNNLAVPVYELLNKPVYCRCGTEIVVKVLKDQWFIDYGNEEWKKLAKRALDTIKVIPVEARSQFEATIDWLKRRACARTRGLGTPLPWDNKWIIESLSDSTIYMAFYTVVHKLRGLFNGPKYLPKSFWDYVFLGKGSVDDVAKSVGLGSLELNKIREEFLYWYPLDVRVSGKDLIPNHLTFFIFNHVALFPQELWPKAIIANGWVLIRGQKMSKSARNIIPLKKLIDEYGADIVRLILALNAEIHQDENIDISMLERLGKEEYPRLLLDIEKDIERIFNDYDKLREDENIVDKWFENEFKYLVSEIEKAMNEYRVRDAGIKIFYGIKNLIENYITIVKVPHKKIIEALKLWIALMSVFTPYIAEEIWSKTIKNGRVTKQSLPLPKDYDKNILLAFRYANLVLEAVNDIMKALKKEKITKAVIYIASPEQQQLMKIVAEATLKGLKLGEVIDYVASRTGLSKKDIGKVVKQLYDVAINVPEELRRLYMESTISEFDALTMVKDYMESRLGAKIEYYQANDERAPNYGGKRSVALPLRPGIYVE
ncbi:MAG: leucine--tRNA ligase [Ignisphaera sp.]|nr:leucine--tRNA ligase [Ignisphaera sp.]